MILPFGPGTQFARILDIARSARRPVIWSLHRRARSGRQKIMNTNTVRKLGRGLALGAGAAAAG